MSWREVKWRVEGSSIFRTDSDDEACRRTSKFLEALDGVSAEKVEVEILGCKEVSP